MSTFFLHYPFFSLEHHKSGDVIFEKETTLTTSTRNPNHSENSNSTPLNIMTRHFKTF